MRRWLVLCLLVAGAAAQTPSALDTNLVQVVQQDASTAPCLSYIYRALGYLPENLKQRLLQAGVRVVLQPSGGAHFEPRTNHVVISEHEDGATAINPRGSITTLHELGHAYDRMLGYPSGAPDFLRSYQAEASRVPPADRGILAHFLQPPPKRQRECFASLFACKYYPGPDRRLDRLRADFPQTLTQVP